MDTIAYGGTLDEIGDLPEHGGHGIVVDVDGVPLKVIGMSPEHLRALAPAFGEQVIVIIQRAKKR
jgi:hypothetical protein